MEALINKIIVPSFVDGPGSRMAVFLQGCNFNCIYCHNPETKQICNNCGVCVSCCPSGALTFFENKVQYNETICINCNKCIFSCPSSSSPKTVNYTIEDLLVKVEENLDFIDGITFSGGECTLQSDFIAEFSRKAKDLYNLGTFIDTNGFIDSISMNQMLPFIDGYMIDLKAFTSEVHLKITAQNNIQVFKSIYATSEAGKLYEIRLVLLEDINDSVEQLNEYFLFVKNLNDYTNLKLIPFNPVGVRGDYSGTPRYSIDKYMYIIALGKKILGDRIIQVRL